MNKEVFFNDPYILSETDEKGQITFVSDSFCEIAGYSREELMGKPHNIVRHTDMPRTAFKIVWDSIQTKGFWKGIVKNKTKDDNFYWVEAMVLRKVDHMGNISYVSVRTKPTREQIEEAWNLYKTLP